MIFAILKTIKSAFAIFSKGVFGSFLIKAGASLIASQLASALSKPPTKNTDDDARRADRQTSLDGNVLAQGAPIPRVMGSQRIYPALLSEPLYYYERGVEVVEGTYALSGPHDIELVHINGAPADSLSGVEIVINDGTRRTRANRLLTRYGFTETVGAEMNGHIVRSDGVTLDISGGSIESALPQSQVYRKRARADEFWAQIVFGGGLHREASATDPVSVPIRVRIRADGGDWRNMPELHFRGRTYAAHRATVRLIWAAQSPLPSAVTGDGFVRAIRIAPHPGGEFGGGWVSDPEFTSGAGDSWLDVNNVASTSLDRVQIDNFEARFYLDPAEFAPGEWDVEIVRGCGIRDTLFNPESYQYSGTVRDFFGHYGDPARIPEASGQIQDAATIARAVSVVNGNPSPSAATATIEVRARGLAVSKVSALAHGLVRAWGVNLLSDGYAPFDWNAFGGATKSLSDINWLGRHNESALVTSAGDANARIVASVYGGVSKGTHRCRALVVSGVGGRVRMRVLDGGDARTFDYDLEAGTLGATSGIGGASTGDPYLREIAVGVYEVGVDIYATTDRGLSLGVGPGSATAGDNVIVLMGDVTRPWEQFQRSDNPADLLRDVLTARRWAYPFEVSRIDEGRLLDWHDRCRRAGYKCRSVIEGNTLAEMVRIVTGAGFAGPDMIGLGITQDYDRRGEQPVHIFTPRNSAGLQFQTVPSDGLPVGLRVKYRDAESVAQETIVLFDGVQAEYRQLEEVEYESVQTEAEAVNRGLYDLRSAYHRRAVYSLAAPQSQLALLPGSLVGIVDDAFADVMAAGTIQYRDVEAIGVNADDDAYYIVRDGVDLAFYAIVSAPALDSEYQSIGSNGWSTASAMSDLGDMRRSGMVLEVIVQQPDGAWLGFIAQPFDGRTNMLAIDATNSQLPHGAEVAIIIHGHPELMVVAEIAPRGDLTAQVVLTPDASAKIWGQS